MPLAPKPSNPRIYCAVELHQFVQHDAKTEVFSSKEYLMFGSSTFAPFSFCKILITHLFFIYQHNKIIIIGQYTYCITVRQEIVGAIVAALAILIVLTL